MRIPELPPIPPEANIEIQAEHSRAVLRQGQSFVAIIYYDHPKGRYALACYISEIICSITDSFKPDDCMKCPLLNQMALDLFALDDQWRDYGGTR